MAKLGTLVGLAFYCNPLFLVVNMSLRRTQKTWLGRATLRDTLELLLGAARIELKVEAKVLSLARFFLWGMGRFDFVLNALFPSPQTKAPH